MLPEAELGFPAFWLFVPWTAVACLWMVLRVAERDGAERWRVVSMQAAWSLAAIVGGKLFAMAEAGRVFDIDGALHRGWRYSGGFLSVMLAAVLARPWVLPGISLARYADWLAPSFAAGHALMRLSCYFNGCCTGRVCDAAWCISFHPGSAVAGEQFASGVLASPFLPSLPVLPLHFLFLAAALGVALFLAAFDSYRRFDGQTFLLFLALHEGTKFGLEFLRNPSEPVLQVAAGLPAVLGIVALYLTRGLHMRDAAQVR